MDSEEVSYDPFLQDLFEVCEADNLDEFFRTISNNLSDSEKAQAIKILQGVKAKTSVDPLEKFSSTVIYLSKAEFETYFHQASMISELDNLLRACQKLGLSSVEHDDFTYKPRKEKDFGVKNISRFLIAKNLSKVPTVLHNFLLLKIASLPAFALYKIDPMLRKGFNKLSRSAQSRLSNYRDMARFFQRNSPNLLINRKKVRLYWFRTRAARALTLDLDCNIPDDCVDFDFLDQHFGKEHQYFLSCQILSQPAVTVSNPISGTLQPLDSSLHSNWASQIAMEVPPISCTSQPFDSNLPSNWASQNATEVPSVEESFDEHLDNMIRDCQSTVDPITQFTNI